MTLVAIMAGACQAAPIATTATHELTPEPEATATIEPTATPEPVDPENALQFSVEECFNPIDRELELGHLPEDHLVARVDCEELHYYEVFAVLDHPAADAAWPGTDQLRELGGQCIGQHWEDYFLIAYPGVAYYSMEILPSEQEWDDGMQSVVCALYSELSTRWRGLARREP